MKLSVIIPVYNEETIIPELYARLHKTVAQIAEQHELIFVNDGSRDNTYLELQKVAAGDTHAKYIHLSRNFGHQRAVMAGLDHCSGEAVVIIDGDLQDPPELIADLYRKYCEGYQVVYARRKSRKGETFFKKFTAKMFYRLMQKITQIDIPLDTGDFRIIDRKIVNYLRQMPEQNKFLRGQISWLGFRQTYVEFERQERKAGVTGYSLKKMITFAMDGITAFSETPLKLVTRTGIVVSGLSFLIILYAVYSHFVLERTVTGWTSVIISTMFIGGIQLLSLGIIGEYISRIHSNTRNRPIYIIGESNIDVADKSSPGENRQVDA